MSLGGSYVWILFLQLEALCGGLGGVALLKEVMSLGFCFAVSKGVCHFSFVSSLRLLLVDLEVSSQLFLTLGLALAIMDSRPLEP